MFWLGYRVFIRLFHLVVSIRSLWDAKTKQFLEGRRDNLSNLTSWLKANDFPVIQIHSASLGEYELSLPLYHSLKSRYPNHKFLFTFFSPSGFEHAKIPQGECKSYLPFDQKRKVNNFLDNTDIKLVIFIKYEFWFMYLNEIEKRNIPFGFVNINQQHLTTNLKFKTAKDIINKAAFVCTSNPTSKFILESNGLKHTGIFSDLRYSQSFQTQNTDYKLSLAFQKFFTEKLTVICGSVWKEDLKILLPIIKKNKDINWVIAPHEIHQAMKDYLDNQFEHLSYFSDGAVNLDSNVLMIDTIGDLKYLYKYGSINYVGGAFKTGLHNVLEPLYAGSLITFGPAYQNFPEAKYLLENGLAQSLDSSEEFEDIIEKMKEGSLHLESPKKLEHIKKDLILLTNLVTRAYEQRS